MTKVKGGYGRVVWMPTFDSEHKCTLRQQRPFARVAKDGKLVPEVVKVIGDRRPTQPGARDRPFLAGEAAADS